jgi:branched-chain amino acid transport system ATP-binding protein
MNELLLAGTGLTAGYDSVPVIRGVSLEVGRGEVVALLGANGAGKTTTMRALAGELPLQDGEVHFGGVATRAALHQRCRHGLGYLMEEKSVFMKLTVAENLRVAAAEEELALGLFPPLRKLMGRKAGLLSGGEQQMLALARALGRRPSMLLADELSLGLAPLVVDGLLQAVRHAADAQGVGVLLVEQHVSKALTVADRVYVMRRGQIVLEGTASDLVDRMPEIQAAYLSVTATDTPPRTERS